MNIPMKYEDVVAQLEAALGRESEMVARANRSKLEMDAASGTIDLLEKDLSIWKQKACEAAEREAALREELEAESKGADRAAESLMQWRRDCLSLQQRLTVAEQRNKTLEDFIARTPDVVFQGCEFRGFNSDGSEPVEMENGVITRIKLVGWWCEGPMQKNFKGEGLATRVDPTFVQKNTIKIDTPHAVMPCPPVEPGLPVTAYCIAEAPSYWPCRSAEELERFEVWKIEDDKAALKPAAEGEGS